MQAGFGNLTQLTEVSCSVSEVFQYSPWRRVFTIVTELTDLSVTGTAVYIYICLSWARPSLRKPQ